MLNTLSDATLVAHTQRDTCVLRLKGGAFICIPVSTNPVVIHRCLKVGYCKYISISCLTFSDTLSVLCAAQFDEILPKIALNLPFFFDDPGKSSLQLSVSVA